MFNFRLSAKELKKTNYFWNDTAEYMGTSKPNHCPRMSSADIKDMRPTYFRQFEFFCSFK